MGPDEVRKCSTLEAPVRVMNPLLSNYVPGSGYLEGVFHGEKTTIESSLSNPRQLTSSLQIKILISALQDKNEMSLFICNLLLGYISYLLPQGFLVIDDHKAPGPYNHKCLLLMCLVLLGVG